MNEQEDKLSRFGIFVRENLVGKEKCYSNFKTMAKRLGISRTHLYGMMAGKHSISHQIAARLADNTNNNILFFLAFNNDEKPIDRPSSSSKESNAEKLAYSWQKLGSRPLVDSDIIAANEYGIIKINPFEKENVKSVSVDLRIGNNVIFINKNNEPKEIPLESGKAEMLKSGGIAMVKTLESVCLPRCILGTLGSCTYLSSHCISLIHGLQCDPGWDDHLWVTLKNVGFHDFPITIGDTVITLCLTYLPVIPQAEAPTESSYTQNSTSTKIISKIAEDMSSDEIEAAIEALNQAKLGKINN